MNSEIKLINGSKKGVNNKLTELKETKDEYSLITEILNSNDYELFIAKNVSVNGATSIIAQEKFRSLTSDLYFLSGMQSTNKMNLYQMQSEQVEELLTGSSSMCISGHIYDKIGLAYAQTLCQPIIQRARIQKGMYGFDIELTQEGKESIVALDKLTTPNEFASIFKSTNSKYTFTNFGKFMSRFAANIFANEKISFSKILINILLERYGDFVWEGGFNETFGGGTADFGAEIVGNYFPTSTNAANPNLNFRACTLGDIVQNSNVPTGYQLIPIRTEDISDRLGNNDWIVHWSEQPFKLKSRTIVTQTEVANIFRSFSNMTHIDGGNVVTGYCFVVVDDDVAGSNLNIQIAQGLNINTVINSPFGGANLVGTCDNIFNNRTIDGEVAFNRWCRYYYNPMDVKIAIERCAIMGIKFPLIQSSRYCGSSTNTEINSVVGIQDADRALTTSGWGLGTDNLYNPISSSYSIDVTSNGNSFIDYQGIRTDIAYVVQYDIPDSVDVSWIAAARHIFNNIGSASFSEETVFHIWWRTIVMAHKGIWMYDMFRSFTHKPLNIEIMNPLQCGTVLQDYKNTRTEVSQIINKYMEEICGLNDYHSRAILASWILNNGIFPTDIGGLPFILDYFCETGGCANMSMFYKGYNWLKTGYQIDEKILYIQRNSLLGNVTTQLLLDEKKEYSYHSSNNESIGIRNACLQIANNEIDVITVMDRNSHAISWPLGFWNLNTTGNGFWRLGSNLALYRICKHKISLLRTYTQNTLPSWVRMNILFTYFMQVMNGTDGMYIIDQNICGEEYADLNKNSEYSNQLELSGFSFKKPEVKK